MAGNTRNAAVKAFTKPIQDALVCFVDGKVTADTYDTDSEGVLTFNRATPTRLPGSVRIHITISMRYRVVRAPDEARGPWKVSTTGWIYDVLDRDEARIVAYHWHPISDSHAKHPHMHVTELGDKRHFPTGRVLIEDVLQLAVDLGAKPRDETKWSEIAERNRSNFALAATWGIGHPSVG